MSDKGDSPAASPRHHDDNDNAGSHSPKSPRAGSASPKSAAGDEGASASSAADATNNNRATSRSPSPVGGAAAGDRTREARTETDASNPGNNLYVANLPLRLSQTEMEEMFSKFGRVEKCEIIADPVTRESRGFGFVSYEDVRDATDAVAELNGKEIHGRRIRIEHAKRQRGHEKTPGKYLGPRQASTKYGIRGGGGRSRSRSRDRDRPRFRSRSRSRDRGRRFDSRDRYDRRYDDRGDRGRGYGYDSRDRYERRSRR